jgi:adenylate kinase
VSELRRVLLVGPPGAGKGMLAPSLAELLGVPHVSSGRLLRASVEQGDPHRIAEQVRRGQAVPDRVAMQVVAAGLGEGFILDGYPRTVRQATGLDALLEYQERRPGCLDIPGEQAITVALGQAATVPACSDPLPSTWPSRAGTRRWPATRC